MKIFDNSEENKKYYEKLLQFVETQEKKTLSAYCERFN